jgi:endonuclease YncB( thermonuclease family)
VPQGTKIEVGQVIRVIDGDTIEVRTEEGDFTVRYIGMDTPESDELFGSQATSKNNELIA